MKRILPVLTVGATAMALALPAPQTHAATSAPSTGTASASDRQLTPTASAVSGSTSATSDWVFGRRKRRVSGNYSSINWAGYAQSQTAGSVKSVSASFVVPKVLTSPRGYASTWVGIDGLANQYLTQVGISEEAVNGRTQYYGWWEVITPTLMLPEQTFRFAIKPGQRVTASVTVASGKSTMTLFNNTTGAKATRTYAYAGPLSSAEWIQEDVYVNGSVSPAPKWGSLTFMGAKRNGASPKLSYTQSIDIVDRYKVKETNTSKPNLIGNAFIVKWLAAGHWTPIN